MDLFLFHYVSGSSRRRLPLSATDKLNNLIAVAGGDAGSGPLAARKNLQVALDSDAAGVEAQHFKQLQDGGAAWRLFAFAIHHDRYGFGGFHFELGAGLGAQLKAQVAFGAIVRDVDHQSSFIGA